MKSFTDIEQSKKLAKILPIESADMSWYKETKMFPFELHTLPYTKHFVGNDIDDELLPCWSLSALLGVYPMIVGRDMDMYCCWQNSKNLHSRHYDNPIDACVEMIFKLKEKGLI